MSTKAGTLVLFHNGHGDYVLALPAMRALCALAPRPLVLVFGEGPQLVLVRELAADLVIAVPYTANWPQKDFDPAPILAQVDGCDLFVSLCPYDCSGQDRLLRQLSPRRSIGFMEGFGERIDYRAQAHEVDVVFGIAQAIAPEARVEEYAAPVQLSQAADEAALRMRTALGTRSTLIVAHIDTRPDKAFPRQRFDRILHRWLDADAHRFALLINEQRADWPAAGAGGRCGFLRGASLENSMAATKHADLFVGVDSCMLHVADFERRGGIGLFGPSDPRRYGFRFSRDDMAKILRAGESPAALDDDIIVETGNALLANINDCR